MVVTVPNDVLLPGEENVIAFYAEDTFLLETYINLRVTLRDASGCSTAVYTINGVGPDDQGRFTLGGFNGALVTADPDTHTLAVGTIINAANLCTRTGDVGAAGPTGPAGPAGAGGTTPPPQCCTCNTCESCNTCEICNTCEGYAVCGEGDLTFRPCHTLADSPVKITTNPESEGQGKFKLVDPLDSDPCDAC